MRATSKTIVRAWTKDGYHKDILVMDSEQVRMCVGGGIQRPTVSKLVSDLTGVRMVIDPKEFPEMVEFEIIVVEQHHKPTNGLASHSSVHRRQAHDAARNAADCRLRELRVHEDAA